MSFGNDNKISATINAVNCPHKLKHNTKLHKRTTSRAIFRRCRSFNITPAAGICKSLYKLPLKRKANILQ